MIRYPTAENPAHSEALTILISHIRDRSREKGKQLNSVE